MSLFKQKIHWRGIFGQVGLLIHVPAGMAFLSMIIALIFEEWFALIPFAVTGIVCLAIGQTLYRCCFKAQATNLWDRSWWESGFLVITDGPL